MEDWRLLQQYAKDGSEAAFTALVDRYMDLVYSTALRRLNNPEAAQEVSQSVFSLLAQKARQLRSDTAFVSWFYRTTTYKAAKYWRAECRRRKREEEAARMQSVESAGENVWDLVLPHLDEAMAQLNETDRLAVLLRFFQRKALKEVGVAFGIGEDAARMRVNWALDKLHTSLTRKGLAVSTAALAAEMAQKSVQATPLDRARVVREAALEAAKVASIPSLLTTFLIVMANTKFKTGVAIAVVLLAGTTAVFLMNRTPEPQAVKDSQELTTPEAKPGRTAQEQERTRERTALRQAAAAEKAQQLRNLIANLQKALGEEAVVSEGHRYWYPVAAAVEAFGSDKSAAIPILLEATKDTNQLVRMNSGLGIAYLGDAGKEMIPQLLELAQAPDARAEVRAEAMTSLGRIAEYDPVAVSAILPELIDMLNDPTVARLPRERSQR